MTGNHRFVVAYRTFASITAQWVEIALVVFTRLGTIIRTALSAKFNKYLMLPKSSGLYFSEGIDTVKVISFDFVFESTGKVHQ